MRQRAKFPILLTLLAMLTTGFVCKGCLGSDLETPPQSNQPVDPQAQKSPQIVTQTNLKTTPTTGGGSEPTPTRPATKPLEITQVEFEPFGSSVVECMVKIDNPDEVYAISQAVYRVEFLDDQNQVAGQFNMVVYIGPDEQQVHMGTVPVADPTKITSTRVTEVFPGTAVAVSPGQNRVTTAKAFLQQGQGSMVVTGEVSSTYTDDIISPVYTAAAFDSSGSLIGMGSTFGMMLPAGKTMPLSVPIELNQEATSVELYFTPDMGTALKPASDLALVTEQVDFLPRADNYGYPGGVVTVLRNPDASRMAVDVYYTMAVYDAAGNVLNVCEDVLSIALFPGDRLGFGCPLNLPAGIEPARAEVITLPRDAQTPYNDILQNPLTADNVTINEYTITATVHNSLPRDLDYTYLMAVGYDADGKLAGYEFYSLGTMGANESRTIEMGMYRGASTIVRVELFPYISMSTLG